MKKHLANIVTSSRIVGAFLLFCFNSFSPLYIALYVYCGFTDLIDGPIARKTNSSSALGAALDTIGDVLTYLSLVKILIIQKMIPGWLLIWLAVLIVMFFGIAFFSLHKFKKFYLPHTYLGKILGGTVFLLPIATVIMDERIWMVLICSIISVHFFESLYIQKKSKEALDFVPSAFSVKNS